jgi:hypothetical protein
MPCSARRQIPVMARTDCWSRRGPFGRGERVAAGPRGGRRRTLQRPLAPATKTACRCTGKYTKRCSSEWLAKGPARPAITGVSRRSPARLPAPHIDEKKGGAGSRAVSLRNLGSGRAGGWEEHCVMWVPSSQSGVLRFRRSQRRNRKRTSSGTGSGAHEVASAGRSGKGWSDGSRWQVGRDRQTIQ